MRAPRPTPASPWGGYANHLRRLLDGEAGEEAELDYTRQARVDPSETPQGQVDRFHVDRRPSAEAERVLERDPPPPDPLGLVKNLVIISRTLATVGKATEVPRRSPGHGPPYWALLRYMLRPPTAQERVESAMGWCASR
jgi:hypothetical protein